MIRQLADIFSKGTDSGVAITKENKIQLNPEGVTL